MLELGPMLGFSTTQFLTFKFGGGDVVCILFAMHSKLLATLCSELLMVYVRPKAFLVMAPTHMNRKKVVSCTEFYFFFFFFIIIKLGGLCA